jgi:hypothetical protein
MADASEQEAEFDLSAASIGVALLQLQAKASDPRLQPGWVNRRVEQLQFLGADEFSLVPITSLAKTGLVAFSLRDEWSATLWLPTSRQTTHYLASALVFGASGSWG